MGSTFPDMTLTGLKEEFQSTRFFSGVSIGAGFNLPTTLSPYQLKEQELIGKKSFEKKRQELGSPPSETDHPMVTEMRRRVLDAFVEAAELKLI